MSSLIKIILIVAAVAFWCLICSVTIRIKNLDYVIIGKVSPAEADIISFEYKCPHGSRWGIYANFGYNKQLHSIYKRITK